MQLTKFTHACVRISTETGLLTIDPGSFSEVAEALDGVDAVLLTHQHFDHVDVDKLAAAAAANPALRVWAPADTLASLTAKPALEGRVTAVGPGESFTAGGLSVRTFGAQHAVIHPRIPVISNVGYLVEDAVYHPGDSFTVPPASVELALTPTHAPWSKVSEVIDYVIAVRAPRASQIHDSLLTPVAQNMVEGMIGTLAGDFGTTFTHLETGSVIDI